MQKEKFPRNPWSIPTRSRIPYSNDWKSSRWRTLSTMGCSCGWGSHAPFDSTRILPLQEQMVASNKQGFDTMPLRHRSWFQASIVYFATITTSRKRTIRAYVLLQAQTMAVGTEFIFYMVELARFLMVFLNFTKSGRRWVKSCVNEATRFLHIWQDSSKLAFTNSICVVTVVSFTADGGLL